MKRFLVVFLAPVSVVEDWKKTDPATRQAAENEMRGAWSAWKGQHAAMIGEMGACGRTRRVGSDGVSDVKNDHLIYTFVAADSAEAATKIFEGHPHLQIPQSSIDVMEVHSMVDV